MLLAPYAATGLAVAGIHAALRRRKRQSAVVRGLAAFPRDTWPPIVPVHLGFQLMVGLGTIMGLVSAWALVVVLRKRALFERRRLLLALAVVMPFGFIATEAGWTVTEVGRQPWVVQGLLRTSDAVTPMPGLDVPMLLFALLYLGLAAIVATPIASLAREAA
jgi:cytochrome bd ubiquinol oxidase subunit I